MEKCRCHCKSHLRFHCKATSMLDYRLLHFFRNDKKNKTFCLQDYGLPQKAKAFLAMTGGSKGAIESKLQKLLQI
ncbi:hypothetical protein [Helicobacter rodentium]|uniref:hypothetical protein n=2 Tax=Helicobacter rodentium TaxID=59617 RepID=UPI002557FFB7|nr:hypothetical protein [Helicobacter rodentium]